MLRHLLPTKTNQWYSFNPFPDAPSAHPSAHPSVRLPARSLACPSELVLPNAGSAQSQNYLPFGGALLLKRPARLAVVRVGPGFFRIELGCDLVELGNPFRRHDLQGVRRRPHGR